MDPNQPHFPGQQPPFAPPPYQYPPPAGAPPNPQMPPSSFYSADWQNADKSGPPSSGPALYSPPPFPPPQSSYPGGPSFPSFPDAPPTASNYGDGPQIRAFSGVHTFTLGSAAGNPNVAAIVENFRANRGDPAAFLNAFSSLAPGFASSTFNPMQPLQDIYYLGVRVPHHLHERQESLVPPTVPQWAQESVNRIHKAVHGFKTNHDDLISTLVVLDPMAMDTLDQAYQIARGKTLLQVAEGQSHNWFKFGLCGIVSGPLEWDVHLLHKSCSGLGTNEHLLIELLLCRTNADLRLLKRAYHARHGKDIDGVISSELSSTLREMFELVLAERRADDNLPVDEQAVRSDVSNLGWYMQNRSTGTSTQYLCTILVTRNQPHLKEVARMYKEGTGAKLSEELGRCYTGHIKDALVYIAEGAEGDGFGIDRDADMIMRSMKGFGTKDEQLVYRIVRAHWDRPRFHTIRKSFEARHRNTLLGWVKGETSGVLRDLLSAIINLPA